MLYQKLKSKFKYDLKIHAFSFIEGDKFEFFSNHLI